jgi:hypothetical protein
MRITRQRGSLFVEALVAMPGLAFLLLLTAWSAHYNAQRSEQQEGVARCALARATATCGQAVDGCPGAIGTAADYGVGQGQASAALGGADFTVQSAEPIARPISLGGPAPYASAARAICARAEGDFEEDWVVLQVVGF